MKVSKKEASKLLKMNLQTFAVQEFTPDNVMLHQAKDGTIPDDQNQLIVEGIIQNSRLMQLGRLEPMDNLEKKFQYYAGGIGAYWVDEGNKIQTTKPTMLEVTMRAKKLGVILLASREYLNYRMPDFFDVMRPKIIEAFYKKFDEAGILNVDNPFAQSIEESVVAAGNVVEGELNYDNILRIEDLLLEGDIEANAFISKAQNATDLRQAVRNENGVSDALYDRATGNIDGLPSVNLKSANMERGELYVGDFDSLRYGIPYNISYKVSEEAQISTITNPDGSPVNLYEQELIAIRATMDVGFMIVKDEAFAKLQPAAAPEGA